MVLGVNESHFNPQNHKLISSNICDATAIAPIMKLINDLYTIQTGSITTPSMVDLSKLNGWGLQISF